MVVTVSDVGCFPTQAASVATSTATTATEETTATLVVSIGGATSRLKE